MTTELRYSMRTNVVDGFDHPYGSQRAIFGSNTSLIELHRKNSLTIPQIILESYDNLEYDVFYIRVSINITYPNILPEDFGKYTSLLGVVEFELNNSDSPLIVDDQFLSIDYLVKCE